ncbi:MAG: cysteine hydrolase [Chloroflexi bacterium]|nr:cysteine hydrolase [Chloroflexota bacterium]HMN12863.1 isochorismatase family cysteine hydrolase [Bellilinea sp.]
MSDKGQAACSVALLIIDVQRALFERRTPIYRGAELLHNINLLIEKAHQAGVAVIFVQHVNKSFLVEGSEGWQLHPLLTPASSDLVMHKHHGSALHDTSLHQQLQSRGINTLVITGLVTQGCVKATCEAAKMQGYRVILVEDGHSSYHKDAATLVDEWNRKLSEGGIELCTVETVDFSGL